MATQPFPRSEIMAAYEAFVAAGDAGDWNRWADLHTVDGVWNEHNYGLIEGREAIRSKINELMAAVPMMTFPVEWVAIEGNRVVYYPWQVLPDPTGGDEVYRFGCVTILEYAGDGQFSYQEDVYNPRDGEVVFGRWLAAGGQLAAAPTRSACSRTQPLASEPSGAYVRGHGVEVALILVGIGRRELGDRLVETVGRADVRRDRDRIAGNGMGARKRPCTESCVDAECLVMHRRDVDRDLPVPELADVVVVDETVEPRSTEPPEQNVTIGLHEALALNDPLTVVRVCRPAGVGLEHRCLRFLDLQEEGVGCVATNEQRYPTSRADAPDPDDLASNVNNPVALDQGAAVVRQASDVQLKALDQPRVNDVTIPLADEISQRNKKRRITPELDFTVANTSEFAERSQVVAMFALGDNPFELLQPIRGVCSHLFHRGAEVDACVPDRHVRHAGEGRDCTAIRTSDFGDQHARRLW